MNKGGPATEEGKESVSRLLVRERSQSHGHELAAGWLTAVRGVRCHTGPQDRPEPRTTTSKTSLSADGVFYEPRLGQHVTLSTFQALGNSVFVWLQVKHPGIFALHVLHK